MATNPEEEPRGRDAADEEMEWLEDTPSRTMVVYAANEVGPVLEQALRECALAGARDVQCFRVDLWTRGVRASFTAVVDRRARDRGASGLDSLVRQTVGAVRLPCTNRIRIFTCWPECLPVLELRLQDEAGAYRENRYRTKRMAEDRAQERSLARSAPSLAFAAAAVIEAATGGANRRVRRRAVLRDARSRAVASLVRIATQYGVLPTKGAPPGSPPTPVPPGGIQPNPSTPPGTAAPTARDLAEQPEARRTMTARGDSASDRRGDCVIPARPPKPRDVEPLPSAPGDVRPWESDWTAEFRPPPDVSPPSGTPPRSSIPAHREATPNIPSSPSFAATPPPGFTAPRSAPEGVGTASGSGTRTFGDGSGGIWFCDDVPPDEQPPERMAPVRGWMPVFAALVARTAAPGPSASTNAAQEPDVVGESANGSTPLNIFGPPRGCGGVSAERFSREHEWARHFAREHGGRDGFPVFKWSRGTA